MQGGQHRAAGDQGLVFDIQSCLGRGGFGEVYLATMSTPTGVRTEVALKALRADLDPGGDAVKRLRDEGRMLGALRHPSILSVHDLVMLHDRVTLVTEYVEGLDLTQLIVQDPAIPLRPLLAVIGEVASALDAAWRAPGPDGEEPMRLVHRDIKPANIRVGRHGEVKLLDFGVARAASLPREAQTQTDMALGSLAYMSPERFLEEEVAPPSDVYSLGCTLYEGLTRRRVFPKADFRTVMRTMARAETFAEHLRAALAAIPADTGPAVRDLVRRMLSPDPAARPTALEVATLCEDVVDVLPGSTLRRWCRDREWHDAAPVQGAALRPGRVSADTYDQWEIRLARGEPPRRETPEPALGDVIRDRPPPVQDAPPPSLRETTPLAPRRGPPSTSSPMSSARTLPPQRLGLQRPIDPEARFGLDDLSDAEFERALVARHGVPWGRVAAGVLGVVALAVVAGAVWAFPDETRAGIERTRAEVERWLDDADPGG